MKVRIDQESCVAAGQCALTAPDVFDQRESDGVSVLLRRPTAADEELVREAVLLCPAQAIEITDGDQPEPI